jgi:opacity protein-like surface antigen
MRRLLVVLGLIGFASNAAAAEFELPTLRGTDAYIPVPFRPAPPVFARWSGFYGGGQVGYSVANVDFTSGVQSMINDILRDDVLEGLVSDVLVLQGGDTTSPSFGGFLGYNSQWDSVILGVEVNYSRVNIEVNAANAVAGQVNLDTNAPPGHHFTYDFLATGSNHVRLTDVATLRARAGWVANEMLLPYAFGGLAVGRADTNRTATVAYTRTDNPDSTVPATTPLPDLNFFGSESEVKNGGYYFGYAGGIGVDVALLPNLFVRGEWEIVKFQNVKGSGILLNTARTAIGLKF